MKITDRGFGASERSVMIRHAIVLFVTLLFLAVRAEAADNAPYVVTAQATQAGDKITVAVKLVYKEKANVPQAGEKEVTTTVSNPKVVLFEGQRAELGIGKSPDAAGKTEPQTKPGVVSSGFTVDIISVKGRNQIVMVTTVVEQGKVVWADAATVPVAAAKPGEAPK